MIGRVTNAMITQATLDELNSSYARLTTTQAELSSGKRINQPSDDPYGTGVVLATQSALGSLTAYDRNASDGQAWAQAGLSAMSNIADLVQRVRELVVSAANGTNSQGELAGDAAEVSQLIDAVKQEANTSYNGQYIFSGTANTAPYALATGDAYQGNSGPGAAVTRLIGPNTTLQVNADLSSALGSGQGASGVGDGKLLATLRSIVNDMQTGNASALGSTDLSQLDTNFTALTALQSGLGATINRLQLASSRIEDLKVADTQALSDAQDADMAQTEIDYSTQQVAYEAALKAGATIVQTSLMDFLK